MSISTRGCSLELSYCSLSTWALKDCQQQNVLLYLNRLWWKCFFFYNLHKIFLIKIKFFDFPLNLSTSNLVPRVSLLPVPWRERERDPGMVWSRASMKIEDAREGSLYFNCCCHLFCYRKGEAFMFEFNASVVIYCFSRCFTAAFILQFRLAATTTSM